MGLKMLENEIRFLKLNVRILRYLNLWPKHSTEKSIWRWIKSLSYVLLILPAFIPIIGDSVHQLHGYIDDLSGIIENLIAVVASLGCLYMVICFSYNWHEIRLLIIKLNHFQRIINDDALIHETEMKTNKLTKAYLCYGLFGVLSYCALPLIGINECRRKREQSLHSKEIPCGLTTRVYYPEGLRTNFVFIFTFCHHVYTCVIVTSISLTVTTLVCGFMIFIKMHFRYLRNMIRNAFKEPFNRAETRTKVRNCIEFHIMIIEYANDTNRAFSSMMLMHLTITSFVISILGFEMLFVNTVVNSFRFCLHFFGWISMLFLTCYFGQTLIDESTGIAGDLYSIPWYLCEKFVQNKLRLMIIRAQKPLTLTATSLGVISFQLFLTVMRAAYSYFTLLVNLRS